MRSASRSTAAAGGAAVSGSTVGARAAGALWAVVAALVAGARWRSRSRKQIGRACCTKRCGRRPNRAAPVLLRASGGSARCGSKDDRMCRRAQRCVGPPARTTLRTRSLRSRGVARQRMEWGAQRKRRKRVVRVNDDGWYRWMFVACVDAGGSTSVSRATRRRKEQTSWWNRKICQFGASGPEGDAQALGGRWAIAARFRRKAKGLLFSPEHAGALLLPRRATTCTRRGSAPSPRHRVRRRAGAGGRSKPIATWSCAGGCATKRRGGCGEACPARPRGSRRAIAWEWFV